MYNKEYYLLNKERFDYYKKRYYENKKLITCDICKKYSTKRNYDMKRHKKGVHEVETF